MRFIAAKLGSGHFIFPGRIQPHDELIKHLPGTRWNAVLKWLDTATHGQMIRAGGAVLIAIDEELIKGLAHDGRYDGGPAEVPTRETPAPAPIPPPVENKTGLVSADTSPRNPTQTHEQSSSLFG